MVRGSDVSIHEGCVHLRLSAGPMSAEGAMRTVLTDFLFQSKLAQTQADYQFDNEIPSRLQRGGVSPRGKIGTPCSGARSGLPGQTD